MSATTMQGKWYPCSQAWLLGGNHFPGCRTAFRARVNVDVTGICWMSMVPRSCLISLFFHGRVLLALKLVKGIYSGHLLPHAQQSNPSHHRYHTKQLRCLDSAVHTYAKLPFFEVTVKIVPNWDPLTSTPHPKKHTLYHRLLHFQEHRAWLHLWIWVFPFCFPWSHDKAEPTPQSCYKA